MCTVPHPASQEPAQVAISSLQNPVETRSDHVCRAQVELVQCPCVHYNLPASPVLACCARDSSRWGSSYMLVLVDPSLASPTRQGAARIREPIINGTGRLLSRALFATASEVSVDGRNQKTDDRSTSHRIGLNNPPASSDD